jgi:DNA-binding NarL/FixJ family response regulator
MGSVAQLAVARPHESEHRAAGKIVSLDRIRRAKLAAGATAFPPVRVLVADGHALVRAGIRAVLEAEHHIDVVGEAGTGQEAVALATWICPDVVLLDACLPGLDSVEATRRIVERSGADVMLLTRSEGDERNFAALRAGARALVLRDTEPAELARAVELLVRGDAG